MRSAETLFENVTLTKRVGGSTKYLSDGVPVRADTKYVYIGSDANWRLSWKDVEELSFSQTNDMTLVSSTYTVVGQCPDSRTSASFSEWAQQRWIKSTGKQIDEPSTTAPSRQRTKKPRQTYGRSFRPSKLPLVETVFPPSPEQSDQEAHRQTKKTRLRKARHDEVEDSDDELFQSPVVTTPIAQRVVSPQPKSGGNSPEALSDGEEDDETGPPRSFTQGIRPITNFFTAAPNKTDASTRIHQLAPLTQNTDWLSTTPKSSPLKPAMRKAIVDNSEEIDSPPSKTSLSRFFVAKKQSSEETENSASAQCKRRFIIHRRPVLADEGINLPDEATKVTDTSIEVKSTKDTPSILCKPISTVVKKNPWRGLRNLGNTCYLNSSLQMLTSVQGFIQSLGTRGGNLMESIVNISKELQDESAIRAADPKAVKTAIDSVTNKFVGYEQRDAHEFLSDLLDRIHNELEVEITPHNNNNSSGTVHDDKEMLPTDAFFRMNVQVCLTCDSCGYSRTMEEMYRHLSLDIENDESEDPENISPELWSVQKGIDQFFRPEKREVTCEKCDQGTSATQTLKILSRPKALLLHLKRFVLVERPSIRAPPEKKNVDEPENTNEMTKLPAPHVEMIFRKNKAPVTIEESLSLNMFVDNEGVSKLSDYGLKSVVHHIGSTASSGHYTADAMRSNLAAVETSEPHTTWVSFDDGNSCATTLDKIVHSDRKQRTAYMLLYTLE